MELLATPFAPRPKDLDPVKGVGWGNRASLRLVSGPTYHSIELVTNITDPKDIERVEVSLNGSAKVNITGETLVKLQSHRKNYAEPGRYVLSFGDATLRTKVGVRQTDLVTLAGEIWFVYITLKSKPAADAQGTPTPPPSIRACAHVLPSQSTRYYMPRVYELTWFASATGRTPFDFSERSPALNIEYSERNNWRGQVGTDGRFAIFEEPKWGFRAAARILRSYKRRGVKTIHDIVHTFAPSHENDSDNYANLVSRWTGYGKHQVVDVENDDTAAVIIQAMARMEVGHRYPLSDVMKGVKLA